MPYISIHVTKEELQALEKRAKKSYMTTQELVTDIVRRSMISYKNNSSSLDQRIDDKLVALFSRERKGKKKIR